MILLLLMVKIDLTHFLQMKIFLVTCCSVVFWHSFVWTIVWYNSKNSHWWCHCWEKAKVNIFKKTHSIKQSILFFFFFENINKDSYISDWSSKEQMTKMQRMCLRAFTMDAQNWIQKNVQQSANLSKPSEKCNNKTPLLNTFFSKK